MLRKKRGAKTAPQRVHFLVRRTDPFVAPFWLLFVTWSLNMIMKKKMVPLCHRGAVFQNGSSEAPFWLHFFLSACYRCSKNLLLHQKVSQTALLKSKPRSYHRCQACSACVYTAPCIVKIQGLLCNTCIEHIVTKARSSKPSPVPVQIQSITSKFLIRHSPRSHYFATQ